MCDETNCRQTQGMGKAAAQTVNLIHSEIVALETKVLIQEG